MIFFRFHIVIEGKGGWIIGGGGGGGKGYVGPHSQIIEGGAGPPLPMPMLIGFNYTMHLSKIDF